MGATITSNGTAVDPAIAGKGYVHPEVLVSTNWLADHLDDPGIRIIESDEDVLLYDTGHIPGAQKVDWHQDLNDPVLRDYVSAEQFEKLLREKGIDENTTVIFYGDKNNWWAAYAFWVFQLFGFTNAKLLDGGRNRAPLVAALVLVRLGWQAPKALEHVRSVRPGALANAAFADYLAQDAVW